MPSAVDADYEEFSAFGCKLYTDEFDRGGDDNCGTGEVSEFVVFADGERAGAVQEPYQVQRVLRAYGSAYEE